MVEVSCFSTSMADAINTAKPCRAACDKLQLTQMHYNLHKHFFSNRIVAVWNSLPNIVVSAEFNNRFKIVWISYALIKNLNLIFVPT